MNVLLITSNKVVRTLLPSSIFGNYWVINDIDEKIVNIECENDKWKLNSNNDYKILDKDQNEFDNAYLKEYSFYYLKALKSNEIYIIYCEPTFDNNFVHLKLNKPTITIGKAPSNDIIYNELLVSDMHAKLVFENNVWRLSDINSQLGIFVNGERSRGKIINYGDTIFILGLKIILLKDRLIINNPNNLVDFSKFEKIVCENMNLKLDEISDDDETEAISLYKEEDYFLKAPRFKTLIEKESIVIDAPPGKVNQEEMPAIFLMASSLSVAATSLVTLYTTFDSLVSGTRTMKSALPSIIAGCVMLVSMILLPILNRKYQRKLRQSKEQERQDKYRKYILEREAQIDMIMKKQTQILLENYIDSKDCEEIILNKTRKLWERKIDQVDFLKIRLGLGNLPVELDIRYPEEHFTVEEDNLKEILNTLVYKSKILENVPITVSLVEKYILAMVGKYNEISTFVKKMIFQLVAFHSYDDLKIVLFTDKEKESNWTDLKILPHIWSNDKKNRYFASSYDEMQQISTMLEKDFQRRKNQSDSTYKNYLPYYLIIVDNISLSRNIEIIIDTLKQKVNIGFSIIILNEDLSTLPNECTTFVNVNNLKGGIFENELISTKQKEFIVDDNKEIDYKNCFLTLANIPIRFSSEIYSLPDTFNFLEMYNVGRVEQLNSLERWKNNDSTLSLQVPVGIDTHGMLFNLDIHEKAYGPHGLIAGMTGSGKSEFLISYILSLAINYHPDDVSFIIIDYKGGGLAGAFENDISGIKLPHLAGKITNLDTAEMQRALVSIQSELRRRQHIFDETRKKLNEGIIDIYKYQKLYHNGIVKEPVSHLLIISDEFAELKQQQPEFMDQLISAARIGRSLGVHLILATQKPSGIVNDQIRSNSRFRICLKVQEKSDSMDVINTKDAAELKQAGRFYLQVGYNELYALGQSAWSGYPYIPSDKLQKKVDKSIDFVNNIGNIVKQIEEIPKFNLNVNGEQLTNVVKYLNDIAKINKINIRQLWLNKIPAFVRLSTLLEKYNYEKNDLELTAVIGEYDDPYNQRKDLLKLNLVNDGNIIIHGTAGSGKEMLLSTMIYNLITCYSSENINIYILNFGTNLLKMYKNAPQIGDIIEDENIDKVSNLFKFIDEKIIERRKIFGQFSGSYQSYIRQGNKMPLICIILNNYEAFNDTYPDFDDELLQLSREGVKYGIILIITTTLTSLRYRLTQNFSKRLTLRMNDESDYSAILGNVKKMYPSKYIGRGLVKLNNIYEFQTASITEEKKLNNHIENVIEKLNSKYKEKAPSIPVLPEKVTLETVFQKYKNLSTVPLGIEKNTLDVSIADLKKQFISVFASQEISKSKKFIYSLIKELEMLNNINVVIIDKLNLFNNEAFTKALYYSANIYEELNKIVDNYNLNKDNNYLYNIVIILGIDNFIVENPGIDFGNFFTNCKKTGKFNYLLFDNEMLLKKHVYDDWYKKYIVNNCGIWLSNGITEQYSIKVSKIDKSLYKEIGSNFGYNIENGIPKLIKLIDFTEGENDE